MKGTSSDLIGANVSDIEKSVDLFTWFMFEAIGSDPLPDGGKLASFKPNGPAFRNLVTLRLTLDSHEMIQSAQLVIRRAFIDNPRQCVFAGDLAGSFLYHADRNGSAGAPTLLASEIKNRAMHSSATPVITAQTIPDASGKPSAGYRIYLGRDCEGMLRSGDGTIQVQLQNGDQDGEPALVISLCRAPRRGWLSRLIERARSKVSR